MNRKTFYIALRRAGIDGLETLTQSQVNGMEGILNAFTLVGDRRIKTLGYGLATTRREVGPGMIPVREGFSKSDAAARAYVKRQGYSYAKVVNGFVYYGRGLVQLTHDYNYAQEGILNNPDKALEPKWAAELLFKGLQDGRWNGRRKGLVHYLPDGGPDDLENARRTVNVTDHWEEIADWYRKFVLVIVEAGGV